MANHLEHIRNQFPILSRSIEKVPLVYFDNGATSQKPLPVINAISNYYQVINANVHRGVHHLTQLATDYYEAGRVAVQKHINAQSEKEIIFTSGTTESINLVANCIDPFISSGDEIIISHLEHHSNIVPWQVLAEKKEICLKVIPMLQTGHLDYRAFEQMISPKTKFIAITQISNALGTETNLSQILASAKRIGAKVLIDGAQAVPHLKPDVQALGCDFYVFSGHKMLGPTGIGVLYGKEALLEQMPPYKYGSEMIEKVSFERTTYTGLPHKFEPGTPHISGVIALKTAIDYMDEVGWSFIQEHEKELLTYATEQLNDIEGIVIYGAAPKVAVLSFGIEGLHPYDIGIILDKEGIAVRTGHHCAQPIMQYYGISGTVRASFSFYNTKEEVDRFKKALQKAVKMLKV